MSERTVMRQRWSDLLFLHWPVDANSIQALLPPGLTVDTYQGIAYVGLVPFRMSNVHPSWFVPVPGVSDLLECNVRTYVRHEGGSPGVWFFSLDANSITAVTLARTLWRLPYFYAKMNYAEARIRDENMHWTRRISYSAIRSHPRAKPGGCVIRYEPIGDVAPARRNTLEEFLIERYLLYTYKNSVLYCGRVAHSPYQIHPVRLLKLSESLVEAAGIDRPDIEPLASYARNVVVEVFPLKALTGKPNPESAIIAGLAGQPA